MSDLAARSPSPIKRARTVVARRRPSFSGVAGVARTEFDRVASARRRADLAVFHRFAPPPTGGGNQFLRALVGELAQRGLDVEVGRVSGRTPACLFNSDNFDERRLRRLARAGCRMVHRVDGPIGVRRGFDDGTDARIHAINRDLADATILQSRYSLDRHLALGIELRDPVVIVNGVDPAVFFPPAQRAPLSGRKVRLIAASWSDNARKGAGTVAWLESQLDRDRFELTFVGRSPVRFEHTRLVDPVASETLAALLRSHDLYVAPSLDDPCSNALLEALACGLPAAYARSGGHPELVGDAGIPFDSPEELPAVLERLAAEIDERRAAIRVPSLREVADRYLAVLFGRSGSQAASTM
jgi:glycosyltransferase involved in cell wall biosynthesis